MVMKHYTRFPKPNLYVRLVHSTAGITAASVHLTRKLGSTYCHLRWSKNDIENSSNASPIEFLPMTLIDNSFVKLGGAITEMKRRGVRKTI